MKTLAELLLHLNSEQRDKLYFTLEDMLTMGSDRADELILEWLEEIQNEEN